MKNPVDFTKQVYLTTPEAVEYLRFGSRTAFYAWTYRNRTVVRRFGTHAKALYMRRDLDEAMRREAA